MLIFESVSFKRLTLAFVFCQVSTSGAGSSLHMGPAVSGDRLTGVPYNVTHVHTDIGDANSSGHKHASKGCQHKCNMCGLVFEETHLLLNHLKASHFPCPQCPEVFLHAGPLLEHIQYTHEKMCRYRCGICEKGFYSRSHYLDHTAAEHGVKRNVCTICQRNFSYKSTLKVHVLHFHPDEATHIL